MFKQTSTIALASASLAIFAVAVPPAAADDTMWETLGGQIKAASTQEAAEQRVAKSTQGVEGRRAPPAADEKAARQEERDSNVRDAGNTGYFFEWLNP